MSEENLKSKTLRGVGWSFTDNILRYGLSLVIGVILARLLSPREYGLIGIITIFTSFFGTIVDSGFSTALIRKNDATDRDFSTIFITNFVVSIFFFLVLFLGAPAIARFFNENQLVNLTRVVSIIIIINALSLIQKTRLTKNVDFKTQTKITVTASVLSGIVGIVMAFSGYGVWSLVAQQIVSSITSTILLWFMNRYWPRMIFSFFNFKELFGYSWKLMLVGIISSLWNEINKVVVGKYYQPATLGQYSQAKQFSDIFSSNLINNVVQRVSLPVLSKVQDDKDRRLQIMRKITKVTMLVSFTLLIGLAVISKPMIYFLLGEKWMVAATFLPLICFAQILYPVCVINFNMIAIIGRSDICLKYEIIKRTLDILPILVGIFVGIYWMLICGVINGILYYVLNIYFTNRLLNYKVIDQLKDILPSFTLALLMGIVVYLIAFIPISNYLLLPIQLIVGFMVMIFMCEKTKLSEYYEIKHIVISIIHKRIK